MSTKTDDRHAAKLERREESRKRAEARDAARDERDRKLRALADEYLLRVRQVWSDWRAA